MDGEDFGQIDAGKAVAPRCLAQQIVGQEGGLRRAEKGQGGVGGGVDLRPRRGGGRALVARAHAGPRQQAPGGRIGAAVEVEHRLRGSRRRRPGAAAELTAGACQQPVPGGDGGGGGGGGDGRRAPGAWSVLPAVIPSGEPGDRLPALPSGEAHLRHHQHNRRADGAGDQRNSLEGCRDDLAQPSGRERDRPGGAAALAPGLGEALARGDRGRVGRDLRRLEQVPVVAREDDQHVGLDLDGALQGGDERGERLVGAGQVDDLGRAVAGHRPQLAFEDGRRGQMRRVEIAGRGRLAEQADPQRQRRPLRPELAARRKVIAQRQRLRPHEDQVRALASRLPDADRTGPRRGGSRPVGAGRGIGRRGRDALLPALVAGGGAGAGGGFRREVQRGLRQAQPARPLQCPHRPRAFRSRQLPRQLAAGVFGSLGLLGALVLHAAVASRELGVAGRLVVAGREPVAVLSPEHEASPIRRPDAALKAAAAPAR